MTVVEGLPLRQDDLPWALGSLCQLNRIPFDPTLGLLTTQEADMAAILRH